MKAIQYSQTGDPEVLQYTDLPEPEPARGQIVVRLHAASVNHLDVHYRRGLPGKSALLPQVPGSDGAGVVAAVGLGATGVEVGDRVVINPGISCGRCEHCHSGDISTCREYRLIGLESRGTYAEMVAIPAENGLPLPDQVSFETAAAAPLVYLTAWRMVVTKGQVIPGHTVLVMGAGSGVSMAAIQIAKLMGARVLTTASSEIKAARAKQVLGVDHVILYTRDALDKSVLALTNGRGVDVALDHVGGRHWVPLLRSLRNGGTLVTCGATDGFTPHTDLRHIFYRQLRVLGSTMGNHAELAAVLQLVFDGTLTPVIDSVLPLQEAAEAHRRMEARQSFGKLILKPPE